MSLHTRKPNRLKNYNYSQNGSYFITICVQNRHEILSKITDETTVQLTEYGIIVEQYIKKIPEKYPGTIIDQHVIMPDHIHMIITIVGDGSPVPHDETIPQSRMMKQSHRPA